MDIRYHAERAERSERARKRILREGRTPNGHRLWTQAEDAIVRHFYPDYRAMKRRLRRSTQAITGRVHTLGLSPKIHVWKTTEVARLRRMWKEASKAEILYAFPDRNWQSIANKGKTFRVRRRPWMTPKSTGNLIVDKIRLRAIELKLSMRDLDVMFNGGREYFVKCSRGVGIPRSNLYLRVIEALGGHIEIIWR